VRREEDEGLGEVCVRLEGFNEEGGEEGFGLLLWFKGYEGIFVLIEGLVDLIYMFCLRRFISLLLPFLMLFFTLIYLLLLFCLLLRFLIGNLPFFL
jgi:hypothetical protein